MSLKALSKLCSFLISSNLHCFIIFPFKKEIYIEFSVQKVVQSVFFY